MNLRSFGLSTLILFGGLPVGAFAAQVTVTSTVQMATTYPANNGWATPDTIFTLVSGPSGGCDGFWLRPSDAGYQASYAMLLAAQMTQRSLTVTGLSDSADLWTGSTGTKYCLVYALSWQ